MAPLSDRISLCVWPATRAEGTARVPPDKSISHRAAILGALAGGETVIDDFLASWDCLGTLECLRRLGVEVKGPDAEGRVRVRGRPLTLGGFQEPEDLLDVGNSGTTLRLLCGAVAAHPLFAVLTGDASIRRRPMQRVVDPLTRMGATIWTRRGGLAPVALRGGPLSGIEWRLSVASAQVKSAVLLAGVQARGLTAVHEPAPTRDHTERMLGHFGVRIRRGAGWVEVEGPQELTACHIRVPGDPSSAAFLWAVAAALEGSRVTTPGVGLNPTRTAILEVLRQMGAGVEVQQTGEAAGEPVGDVTVWGQAGLRAVTIAGELTARLIDELPVLVVLAALARGTTVIADAQELRHKESDRIDELARELGRLGVHVDTRPDGFVVPGPQRPRGGTASSRGDHRLAMALAVAALAAEGESCIEDAACVATSFPGFAAFMDGLVRAGGGRVLERAHDGT